MGRMRSWADRRAARRLERHLGPLIERENTRRSTMGIKSIRPGDLVEWWKVKKPEWTTDWTLKTAVEEGLKKSAWLYACVKRKADAVASVPFYAVSGEDGEHLGLEHPLQQLLDSPNGSWSRWSFWWRAVANLELAGNHIITKIRLKEDGEPMELWPICPDLVTAVPAGKGAGYLVENYATKTADGHDGDDLKRGDVIHLKYDNPMSDYKGLAPLHAGGRAVDTDTQASDWNKSALANRAVPEIMITHPYPLTPEQWKEARDRITTHNAGPENARRVMVMGNDAKLHQLSLTPIQMDFLPGRAFSRVEICSAFGVPPPLIGDYDKATLANIETSRAIFWLDTIMPLLDMLCSLLDLSLAEEFGEDVRVVYDVSQIQALYPILRSKLEAAKTMFGMGVPVYEINNRLQLGIQRFPGWRQSYLPGTLMPSAALGGLGGLETEE